MGRRRTIAARESPSAGAIELGPATRRTCLDALVWGSTELLVEPMPQWGIFEYTRQRAEAIRSQNSSASQPDFTYAIGSLEWQRQQERAGEGRPPRLERGSELRIMPVIRV